MSEERNNDSNWVVTLALVVAFIVIRLFANTPMWAAWINFFSIILVLGVINQKIQKCLNARDETIKVFEKQKLSYRRTRNILFIVLVLAIGTYSIAININDYIKENSAVINDIISFISIGISIEDDFIVSKTTKYYKYKKII